MAIKDIKAFVARWKGQGNEQQDTQKYWIELLHDVLGVATPTKIIEFEKPVKFDAGGGGRIDVFLPNTRVLIEQKGIHIDLDRDELQSDGSVLSPYRQAKRYGDELQYKEKPRWIVTCNFREFRVYDCNASRPRGSEQIIKLENLPTQAHRLSFLTDTKSDHLREEEIVSLRAGEIVGELYKTLLPQYADKDSPKSLRSLNILSLR